MKHNVSFRFGLMVLFMAGMIFPVTDTYATTLASLNKPVICTIEVSQPCTNAVDGSNGTYWYTGTGAGEKHITIDLGAPYIVETVISRMSASYNNKPFEVWGSFDGTTYTQYGSFTTGSSGSIADHTTPLSSSTNLLRYIRVRAADTTGIYAGYNVYEISVFEGSTGKSFTQNNWAGGATSNTATNAANQTGWREFSSATSGLFIAGVSGTPPANTADRTTVDNGNGTWTTTLQPSASPGIDDAYVCNYEMSGGFSNTNYGTATSLRVGTQLIVSSLRHCRTFLNFTGISALPINQVISMNLVLTGGAASGPSIVVSTVNSSWSEGTITYATQPAVTATDTIVNPVAAFSADGTYTVPLPQNAWPANGIQLKNANEAVNAGLFTFNSSEATTASVRPKLVITYNTDPVKIQAATISTTLSQTSDDGAGDSVNAGGFNAGTTTGGVTVLGDGSAAQLAVPALATISARNGFGDGHNGVTSTGWPLLKNLGDGSDAISTASWPLLNQQGDGTDGAVTFSSGTVDLSVVSSDSLPIPNTDDDNPGQPDGFTTALMANAVTGATSLIVDKTIGFEDGDQVMILQTQHAFEVGRDYGGPITPADYCGYCGPGEGRPNKSGTYEFRDAGNAGKYEFATVTSSAFTVSADWPFTTASDYKVNGIPDGAGLSGLTPGLVGLWHMNGTPGAIASGTLIPDSQNNVAVNNGIALGAGMNYVQGVYGQGISFGGSGGGYVTTGVNGRPSNTFTFEAWVKTNTTTSIVAESTTGVTGGGPYMFGPRSFGGISNMLSGAGVSVGTNGIKVMEYGSTVSGHLPTLAMYTASIGSGWNHVAVVFNNKTPSIYLNGVLVHTGLTSTRDTVYAPIDIGGGPFGSGNTLSGTIDEAAVYDTMLSAGTLLAHYQNGVAALVGSGDPSLIEVTAGVARLRQQLKTIVQTSENGAEDTPNAGGFSAGTLSTTSSIRGSSSDASASVILTGTPIYDDGTGADGVLDLTSSCTGAGISGTHPNCTISTAVNGGIFNYTTVDIPVGVTLRATGANPLVIKATGNVTIAGILNANGFDASGQTAGAGGPSGGAGGNGGNSGSVGGSGTGTGRGVGGGSYSGAGGGAGYSSAGSAGTACNGGCGAGGVSYGTADLATLAGGSGGGGGGAGIQTSNAPGGGAGGGGGAVKISTRNALTITGTVSANGGIGSVASLRGGGSGSGGSIYLQGHALTITGSVTATGRASGGGGGGASSNGRVRLDYLSLTGNIGSGGAVNPVPGYTACISGCDAVVTSTYLSSGNFESAAIDLGADVLTYGSVLGVINWNPASQPASTSLAIEVQTGTTTTSDCPGACTNWTAWTAMTNGADIPAGLDSKRYLRYRATLSTTDTSVTPRLDDLSINYYTNLYADNNPTIVNNTGLFYQKLLSFTETLGAGTTGAVRYQISNDGVSWYYHNGATWVAASGFAQTNTAAEVNTGIATFHQVAGIGNFFYRAYLNSNGFQPVAIDQIAVTYRDPVGTVLTISGGGPSGGLINNYYTTGFGKAQVVRVPQYTTVTIDPGVTLTANNYSTQGISNNGGLTVGVGGTQGTVGEAWANGAGASAKLGGQALSLDGVDDTVGLPPASFGNMRTDNGVVSIALWVYIPAGETDGSIFCVSGGSGVDAWLGLSGGQISSSVWAYVQANYGALGHHVIYDSNVISTDAWHHIAVVSSNGYWSLYVDNSLRASQALITRYGTVSAPAVGCNSFQGRVDELGIYNTALSAAEISSLYNGGAGRAIATGEAGVEAAYHFNDGTGSIITDSGNAVIRKGGVLALKATSAVTINGTIDMNGRGYTGGVAGGGAGAWSLQGETYTGYRQDNYRDLVVLGLGNNFGGGGYGWYISYSLGAGNRAPSSGASGGGGHGTAGTNGGGTLGAAQGGSAYGSPNLTTILPGSGGGGNGGNGGGIIFITGNTVTLGGSAIVRANGISTGSGGAGGSIYLGAAGAVTVGSNQVTASGGVGTGNYGSGGVGRVYIEGASIDGNSAPGALKETNSSNYAKINGYPTGVINSYASLGDESAGDTQITISASDASAFAVGDEILIIQMQHPNNAGRYEFRYISVMSGSCSGSSGTCTITFVSGLLHNYYGASPGHKAQIVRVPNYTDFAVGGGTALTTPDYNPATGKGGIIAFRANGTVTVDGKIDTFGRGFPGGQIYRDSHGDPHVTQGWSYNGVTPVESFLNNAGGGGVRTNSLLSVAPAPGTSGGGGSYATSGYGSGALDKDASAGVTYGEADLSLFMLGSGGGGTITGPAGERTGSTDFGAITHSGGVEPRPGIGGFGGGAVFMTANTVTVSGTGLITAAGGTADSSYMINDNAGDFGFNLNRQGGAGSGGSIYLGANTVNINTQRVQAAGGNSIRGLSPSSRSDVVTGGNGRIYIEGALTGTAVPTATTGSNARLFAWPNGIINKYASAGANNYTAGPTATSITVMAANGIVSGDEILIIQMAHPTNAGKYEFKKNVAVSGNTITFDQSGTDDTNKQLQNNYFGTGSGGKTQVVSVPNYTNLTVADGEGLGLVAAPYSTSTGTGGIIAFRANGTVTVRGPIDAYGKGFAGGDAQTNDAGYQGVGTSGATAIQSALANTGGAGGGMNGGFSERQGGGGGGGHATAGTNGQGWNDSVIGGSLDNKGLGGSSYGDTVFTTILAGAGGGSGSAYSNDKTSGAGGAGGGLIFMAANAIDVAAKGFINAKGSDGGHPSATSFEVGGGGGGAGGSIFLTVNSVNQWAGSISAIGGIGGGFTSTKLDTTPNAWLGGDGGKGRVRIEVPGGSGTLPNISSAGVVSIADAASPSAGTFTSSNVFAGYATDYGVISWTPTTQPAGSSARVFVRASNTPFADAGTSNLTSALVVGAGGSQTTTTEAWNNAAGANAKLGGQALSFDGTDDYVSVPDDPVLDFNLTQRFSVEAWVKTSAGMANGVIQQIVAKAGSTNAPNYNLRLDGDGTKAVAKFVLNDGTNNPFAGGATNIADGNWHHLVGVRDVSTDTVKIYVDGILDGAGASVTDTTTITLENNGALEIGRFGAALNARYFTGSIDEVVIYKTALTQAEITARYNANNGSQFTSATLDVAAGWHLNEASGAQVTGVVGTASSNIGSLVVGAGGSQATTAQAWGNATGVNAKLGGQALSFDGTDDYVEIPSSAGLNVQAFTFEAWINSTTITNNTPALYMRGDNAGGNELFVGFSAFNENMIQVILDGTVSTMTGFDVLDGTWRHITVTYDGNTLAAYVNGVLFGSPVTISKVLDFGNSNALIGADYDTFNGTLGNYWNGRIDEAVLYNRALSPTEITARYNANSGSEATSSMAGLITGWHFNDGSGTQASAIKASVGSSFSSSSGWIEVTNGQNLGTLFDGMSYLQYGVQLDGSGGGVSFDDLSIAYSRTDYPVGTYTIVSSPFNSQDPSNRITSLKWVASTPANTSVKFQLRTSADGVTWSPWYGLTDVFNASGLNSYFTASGQAIPPPMTDGLYDRYFQYRAILENTLPTVTPTLASVSAGYATGAPVMSVTATTPTAFENGSAGVFTITKAGATGNSLTVNYTVSGTATGATNGSGALSINSGGTQTTSTQAWNNATGVNAKLGGRALSFDGTDDFVGVVNNVLDITGVGSRLTVEAWFKANTLVPTWQSLLYKGSSPGADCVLPNCSDRQYAFFLNNTGYIQFVSTAAGATAQSAVATPAGIITAGTGTWFHVAGVIDSVAGTMKIYVNGTERASGAYSTAGIRSAAGGSLYMGTSSGNGMPFNGYLDEVLVYNQALSTTQIAARYNSGSGLEFSGTVPGLVSGWHLNDGTGTSVTAVVGGGDYTALSGSVVFASADTTRTINVAPLNDALGEGNETVILTLGTGTGYFIGTPSAATVTITDDESAGITVTPVTNLFTTEAAGVNNTTTFTVVLNSQPSANVTIGLSTSDTTEGAPSPSSLTFTTTNWGTPQTVTVTGVDDTLADGNLAYTIITAPASSLGGGTYNGLNASDVTIVNLDNDSAKITVTPVSGLHTTEGGGQATFTVSLNGISTGNVTIGLTSTDTTEGTVSPASLMFTPANSPFPQTVTVTGQADALSDGSVSYKVITAASSSTDSNYNNFNAPDVHLVNLDSSPGVSIITDQTASMSWPFTNSKDFTISDTTNAEVSAGAARLKLNQSGTPRVQTSDNGTGDTPNAGGFAAGTLSPGISVTGTGAAASVVKAITAGPSTETVTAAVGTAGGLDIGASGGLQTSATQAWQNATGIHAKLGGQAISFDGTNDSVAMIPANGSGATGSMSMWIKSADGTATHGVWEWFRSSTDRMYLLVNASQQLEYCFDSSAAAAVCSTSGVSVADLAWHHVVAVWGDGGNIRIYVDGVLRDTDAAPGSTNLSGMTSYIGRTRSTPGNQYFNGYLDEVAMYNTPLSLAQVQYLYNSGTGIELAVADATAGTGVGSIMGTLVVGASGTQTTTTQAWGSATALNAKLGGQALSFDGTDDYVSVANVSNPTSNALTMEAWIKTSGTNSYSGIIDRFTGTTTYLGYDISVDNLGRLRVELAPGVGTTYATVAGTTNLETGIWYHVAATYDGSTIRVYVNGNQENSLPYTGGIAASTQDLIIGNDFNAAGRYFNGFIDEAAVYNRALSAAEITARYNANNGIEVTPADTGLQAGLHFNQGSGTSLLVVADPTAGTGGAGLIDLWHLNDGAPMTAQPFVSAVMDMGSSAVDIGSVSWLPVSQTGTAALQVEMRKGSTPVPLTGHNPGTLNVGSAGQTTAAAAWNSVVRTPVDGQGLYFDGLDDKVTVGSNNRPANNFTVEFWAKTSGCAADITTASTTGTAGMAGQTYVLGAELNGGTGDANNAGMGVSMSACNIQVFEHSTGYMPPIAVHTQGQSGLTWHHVAVVYTNKQPTIYRNGVLIATGLTSPKTNVYAPIEIGGGAYGFFNGAVDQVAIWNRSLSAEEIFSHYYYNGTSTILYANPKLTGDESGLVGLWHFNEGSGTNIADSSLSNGAGNSSWTGWVPVDNGVDTLTALDGQRYLQYRALLSNSATNTAQLDSLTINAAAGAAYDTGIVTVVNKTGIPYQQLLSFADTLGPNNAGTVKYQLSNNGSTWYYHNGTAWISAASAVLAQANSGGEVAGRIGSFGSDVGAGTFYFRALLNSTTGTELVELDKIAISYVGNTVLTSESGMTGSFKMVLNTAPANNVTVPLANADLTEGTVMPLLVTFTPSDWSTAKTVYVTPVNDNLDDGDITYTVSTGFSTSVDSAYNHLGSTDVTVINLDDDTAGITVNPISGLQTSEAGGTTSFNVVLDTQPTSSVAIGLSSSNTAEGTVPPSVSFTTGNWSTPQAITITGVNDGAADGNIAYNIVTAAATSSDSVYNGINPDNISVTNVDNENVTTGSVIITPSNGLVTTEAGGAATFSVALNMAPTADVTMSLFSSDASEGIISSGSLTFTNVNWSVPQLVSITGVDDGSNDGNVTYAIVTRRTVSADTRFNGINPVDVSVVNQDNDFSATAASAQIITVSASDVGAVEGGADTGEFTITRAGSTVHDLTVNYSVSGTATAGTDYETLSGSAVIPEGSSSVAVEVVTIDDSVYEGDETVEIKIVNDLGYVVSAPNSATVVIYDDELPPPPVNLALDQTVEEGGTVNVDVYLGDSAPEYPVEIPYTVTGTSNGSDHNTQSGTFVINSGTLGGLAFTVNSDGITESDETVVFTLGTPLTDNVRLGTRTTHTVTITEGNIAPKVDLVAAQGGDAARLIVMTGGFVTVTANVTDNNASDTHSYDWSGSNNNLIRQNGPGANEFIFDPAGLAAGYYSLRASVVDSGGATVDAELLLHVVATAPVLSAVDTDGDGVNDDVEGYGDADNDGIPNYLDSNLLPGGSLQGETGNVSTYLLRTNPELSLTLGDVAIAAAHHTGFVTAQDIVNYGGGEGTPGTNATDTVQNVGGYVDINVSDLAQAGQSIDIVIPQLTPIPASAVYRKYNPQTGWNTFVADTNNAVASAPGTAGVCPAPNDVDYTAGLTEGYYCVQLTIEDGGPNDADGAANYQVKDPGGVGTQSSVPTITISKRGGGGGGALNLMALLGLMMLLVVQRKGNR